jgi:hypothetical protein
MNFRQYLEPIEEKTESQINDSMQKKQPENTGSFLDYLEEIPEPEGKGKSVLRQAGQYGIRLAEGFAGAPGEIQELTDRIFEWTKRKFGISKYSSYEEKKAADDKSRDFLKKVGIENLDGKMPTTLELRNVSKEMFGEEFEPKGATEEKIGKTFEDIGTLLFPVGEFKIMRPVLTGIGKNIAGQIGESIAGEKGRVYGELGALFVGAAIKRPGANTVVNKLYEEARDLRNSDTIVSASKLSESISSVEKELLKGSKSAASKTKSLGMIKDIKEKIKSSEITISELEAFKRDINEASGSAKIWEEGIQAGKRNKSSLKKLGKSIDDTIENYGKKNPEYLKKYRAANNAASAVYGGQSAANFAEQCMRQKGIGVSDLTKAIFEIRHPISSFVIGPIKNLFKYTNEVIKSPELRKHYINIVKSAAKEDAALTTHYLKKFDKEVNKQAKSEGNFKNFLESQK